MKILIADDDTATRELVSRALQGDGHEVVTAGDGLEAWATFEAAGGFDLLLSDISMPGLDGVKLAEKILGVSPDIKVVLMSGLDAEIARVDSLRGRGVKTITKPFSLDDMRALVKGS